jgi:hypothetical protein
MMKALGSFQPLAVALGEAALYARFENALYRIEARYLGAVQARDASAARLHRGTYNEATRQMGLTAARLSRAIDEAHSWLRTQQELEAQARKTLSRWSRKGLRRDQSGARSALDAKTAGMVETLIRSPKLLEAAMEGIEANLIRLRSAVMQASAYAARDRLRLHPRRHMS